MKQILCMILATMFLCLAACQSNGDNAGLSDVPPNIDLPAPFPNDNNISESEQAQKNLDADTDGGPENYSESLSYVVRDRINDACEKLDFFGGAYSRLENESERRFVCVVLLTDTENENFKSQVLSATEHDETVVFEKCRFSLSYMHKLHGDVIDLISVSGNDGKIIVSNRLLDCYHDNITVTYSSLDDSVLKTVDEISALDTAGGVISPRYYPDYDTHFIYPGNYLQSVANGVNVLALTEDIIGGYCAFPCIELGRVRVFYDSDANPGLKEKIIAEDTRGGGDAIVFAEYEETYFTDYSPAYLSALCEDIWYYFATAEGTYGFSFCFVDPEGGRVRVLYSASAPPDIQEILRAKDTEGGGDAIIFEEYDSEIVSEYFLSNLG